MKMLKHNQLPPLHDPFKLTLLPYSTLKAFPSHLLPPSHPLLAPHQQQPPNSNNHHRHRDCCSHKENFPLYYHATSTAKDAPVPVILRDLHRNSKQSLLKYHEEPHPRQPPYSSETFAAPRSGQAKPMERRELVDAREDKLRG